MFAFLLVIHIIACFVLIAVILLQAGKGGGLTEAFGGEQAQSVLGTQAPEVLKKATEVCAIVFIITSLALAVVTARKGRSLFMQQNMPQGVNLPANGKMSEEDLKKALEEIAKKAKESGVQGAEQAQEAAQDVKEAVPQTENK